MIGQNVNVLSNKERLENEFKDKIDAISNIIVDGIVK